MTGPLIKENFIFVFLISLSALSNTPCFARDDRLTFNIANALKEGRDKGVIGDDVKLFFGKTKYPEGAKLNGKLKSNRKTNALNKTDIEACNWVFLSAVKSLQDGARGRGANAVVGIRSVYKGANVESATEYLCGAGALLAGVALEGSAAKIP